MKTQMHMMVIAASTLGLLNSAPAVFAEQSGSAEPNFYGLVVGIDQYKAVTKLDGAVNDAKTVAAALRSIGAKKVLELNDDKATRDNIIGAWNTLAAEAKKGDVIIFSYAGHGAQSRERISGNETDGKDEFFVLTNFENNGKNTYERIIDDDLQIWFSKVPDINVVLLADSCHSGTMTRGYRQSKLKYRFVDSVEIKNDALPLPDKNDLAIADERKTPLPNVVGLSAVADHELDPEVEIDGKTHGALSWYFAQGLLKGDADTDHNGKLSALEIKNYVYEKVKEQTEGQQHPQFQNADARVVAKASNAASQIWFGFVSEPQDSEWVRLASAQLKNVKIVDSKEAQLEWNIRQNALNNKRNGEVYRLSENEGNTQKTKGFKRATADDTNFQVLLGQVQAIVDKYALPVTSKEFPTEAADLSFIFTAESQDTALVNFAKNQLKHIKVADANKAELEWNIRGKIIRNVYNDVVYQFASGEEAPKTKGFKRAGDDPQFQALINQVQMVIDKYLLVNVIKTSGNGGLNLSLEPNDKVHKNGETVKLVVDHVTYPFFTLFNLASDGTVNFLYPSEATDSMTIPLGQPYSLPISVTPPFGADHFIAITSEAVLSDLHQVLKQADSKQYDSEKLLRTLQNNLKDTRYQIGIHATFTAE